MRSHLSKEQLKKDDSLTFRWNYEDCLLYADGREVSYAEFVEKLDAEVPESVIYDFLIKQVKQYKSCTLEASFFMKEVIEGKYQW